MGGGCVGEECVHTLTTVAALRRCGGGMRAQCEQSVVVEVGKRRALQVLRCFGSLKFTSV
eukprot:4002953-Amphidinium_carterae.3